MSLNQPLHVICERDVGLFSLVQQVIGNIPWAEAEGRVPIVLFGARTAYWSPDGYQDADTVWEYYFKPITAGYPAAAIPAGIKRQLIDQPPHADQLGYAVDGSWVSAHFGDHPELVGRSLPIPYLWDDPDDALRARTASLIGERVIPRDELRATADTFFADQLAGHFLIGVHVRGTDASSAEEQREHRQGSLHLPSYLGEIQRLLEGHPDARVFVATDDEASLAFITEHVGVDVVRSFASIRHQSGDAAGVGPTGRIMPAYVTASREIAARQGAEAVIDYLLLSRCDYLVHNGSSLARTALLANAELPHTSVHQKQARRAPVSADLIAKVREQKDARKATGRAYDERPAVSFVVHSFNRRDNIWHILDGLRRTGECEIIVCDDGSIDGSRELWQELLIGPNDFLVSSNDLHEIRILDRAIRFAAGDIVCLVQDDDVIPGDAAWLTTVLADFDRLPDLAIVGGFMGFPALSPETKPIWGAGPFQFVHHVNIGPYFLRRSSYLALGGWDFAYSAVGEPGICFDSELCLRAWTQGFRVGYRFAPFKGAPGEYRHDGGTVLFSGATRLANKRRNEAAMFRQYAAAKAAIDQRVDDANHGPASLRRLG